MAHLVPLAEIKTRFPRWRHYVENEPDPEAALAGAVAEAERELRSCVDVGGALPDELQPHYLALVRKHVFDVLHGDTEFEPDNRPQALRDYDRHRADLEALRDGRRQVAAVARVAGPADVELPQSFTRIFVVGVDRQETLIHRLSGDVVLLGDPQQLSQVTKASHLVGSGASVLEHVLGGEATIPKDRGVFLDVT